MNLELWKTKKKELKLNYTELAKLSGVSKRTVEDLFRGYTTNPRIETVQAIEKALDIPSEVHFNTPQKDYPDIMAALNNDGDLLTQDDIKDIVLFIEFKKSNK